ncbi:MAG: VWA domain-containing protein [Chitinophagaceae bacterium]|nr:MAG: VWA domain-containing protein [Chitinophagaceae bacterium]
MKQPTLTRVFCSLLLVLLFTSNLCAQTNMKVEVTVVDDRQEPLPLANVQLLELASHRQLKATSDVDGIARFTLDTPGQYEVSVNGTQPSSDPVMVRANQTGSTSLFLTYNPALQARTRRQTFDRSGLTEIPVRGQVAPENVADGYNRIEIVVKNSAGTRLGGKQVSLVSLVQKKRYRAITGADGMAYFHVPGKVAYDIDVEEQMNAAFIIQDDLEGYTLQQSVVYDEYEMSETRRNDTVTQQITLPVTDKHSRAVYRVRVRRDRKPWSNGQMFLDEIGTRTVYKARTDAAGEAVFILPFGKKYMVHFPYERDVDVVNLVDARNIASGSMDITYVPNPALEHPELFVPKPGQLLLTEFPYYHRTPYTQQGGGPSLVLRTAGLRPEAVLEIGMNAGLQERARPIVNMAFVLDVSGSMAGYERIESLKRGLIRLLDQLRPQDILSITLFNDQPRLLLPAQALGRDRDKIIALIQSIEPSGGTDMKLALQTGYEQAMRNYRANNANTLVILSDGYDSNPADSLLAIQLPWKDKVFCTAIGVGNDYNYDLLKKLVSRGSELLQQAHEGAELERLFSEKLITAGVPALRDVQVEVNTDPVLVCSQTYGLRNVKMQNGGFTGSLPDLFPGQELPALAAFVRAAGVQGKGTYLATVTITYTDVATGKRQQLSELLALSFESEPPTPSIAVTEHRKMYAVAFVNNCLLRMATAFEKKDWKETGRNLDAAQAKLKAIYPDLTDTDIRKLWDKVGLYATALKNIAYKKKIGD